MSLHTQVRGAGAAQFEDGASVRFILEAVALVRRHELVLLELDGRTRRWSLPTARVDGPETAAEALCHRLCETLGVDAIAAAFLGVCHCPQTRDLGIVFELEMLGSAHPAPLTDELLHAAWFRPADLPADVSSRSRLVVQACTGGWTLPFILTHHDDLGVVEPPGIRLQPAPLRHRPQ